ncbi:MAG: cytochrome c [Moheibacter sp.]
MYKLNGSIFLGLLLLYCFYNLIIYTDKMDYGNVKLSTKAVKGETIWLKNNCNACHQIYGLGGYLGPDLTNVYSAPGKSEEYLKVFMVSGIKSMPKYNFSEEEKEFLLQFLKEVDQTGYYPTKDVRFKYSGWVDFKQKTSDYER